MRKPKNRMMDTSKPTEAECRRLQPLPKLGDRVTADGFGLLEVVNRKDCPDGSVELKLKKLDSRKEVI
jgi:hypothetical protein